MTTLLKDLASYFSQKENLTDEEKRLYQQLKSYDDAFIVSLVTRDDIEDCGYDTTNVSDDDMVDVAERMGDAFCDNGYWEILESICEYMEFDEKLERWL